MRLWHRDSSRWAILLVTLLFAGIALALLTSGAWASDTTAVRTPLGLAEEADSIIGEFWINNTLTSADTFENRWYIDDSTFSKMGEIRQKVWLIKYNAADTGWASMVYLLDRTGDQAANGTYSVNLRAVESITDSVLLYVDMTVRDSASGSALFNKANGGPNGISVVHVDSGAYEIIGFLPGFTFNDTNVVISSDTTLDIVGIDQGTPSFATVYGYVRSHDNSLLAGKLNGVQVEAKRVGGTNATDSDTTWLIDHTAQYAYTDTTGYFAFSLMRTSSYGDTTKGYYDIVGRYDGEEIFSIPSLHVPSTGSVNLTGRIASRTN